jgi:hypothetical protein
MAERCTHPDELRVIILSMRAFEGTQVGSLRNRVTRRRASVLWSSSKCRRYFWMIVGIVMRSAVEKFCTAMACCFSVSVNRSIRHRARSSAFPG